ncbi:MAG: DUF669 domain-containing protein [Vicinamibacteria bacterium]
MTEDSFNVDPDEASNLVPEGEYVVTVLKAEKVKAKSEDGYPYIKLQLMVAQGQYEGETVTDQLSESPKAKWRLAQLVKACGLAKKGETGERPFTVASLLNSVLNIKVKHEEYKGMDRARPTRYWMHETTQERLKQEEGPGSGGGTEGAPAADPAASAAPPSSAPAPAAAPAAPAAKRPVKQVKV